MIHKVPRHLEEKEAFLFGLTIRQLIVLGLGGAFAYVLSDFSTPLGYIPLLSVPLAIVVAFAKAQHRHLEDWAIVWLVFTMNPHIYLHRPAEEDERDDTFIEMIPQQKTQELW